MLGDHNPRYNTQLFSLLLCDIELKHYKLLYFCLYHHTTTLIHKKKMDIEQMINNLSASKIESMVRDEFS